MEDPIVRIDSGALRGKVTENESGERVYAFLGIPFAKPPIGDLRFKAPQPEEPWSGIRDATKTGNPCFQKDIFVSQQVYGSEDCLYLNVFTKNINDSKSLKPVMVFIHGGAFLTGSGDPEIYSPGFLISEDIVYVSINYRLGVLGFLRLDDTSLDIPGNAGMKDQVLALKWVQKNISKFGGDPNNVTIFGVSAGSASVNYLLLSPTTKGLFHKAILQSGSVLNPWPHLHPKFLDILRYFNLEDKSQSEIAEHLRQIPVEELIEAQTKLYLTLDDVGEIIDRRTSKLENYNLPLQPFAVMGGETVDIKFHIIFSDHKYKCISKYKLSSEVKSTFKLFAPCVEKPNDSAFLTSIPIDVIRSGNYNKVPMVIGYCSNECLLYTSTKFSSDSNIESEEFIPPYFVEHNDIELENMVKKVRNIYAIDLNPDNKFLAISDSLFIAGIIGLVRHFVQTNSYPIFLYEFNFVGSKNVMRTLLNLSDRYEGACHGDDIAYIFDSSLMKLSSDPDSELTTKRVVKLWTNFAKYGNPTPDKQQIGVSWPPVERDNELYLHIDKELTIKCNPNAERMMLWREIYGVNSQTRDFIP